MNTWLNECVKHYGVDKINSLTEYPSILTYHKLGDKGSLLNELYEENRFKKDDILEITEKIDGTNMRLILTNDDYLVATRSKIIHAKNDRIITDPNVNVVVDSCDYLIKTFANDTTSDCVLIVFGEAYGYNICEGSNVYCSIDNITSRKFRVFDVRCIPCIEFEKLLEKDIQDISRWKSYSNEYWYDYNVLDAFCEQFQLERTPVLTRINEKDLPTGFDATYKWMKQFSNSQAVIGIPDDEVDYSPKFGKSEGVVIRNLDRSVVSKLRFEDCERTIRKRNQ